MEVHYKFKEARKACGLTQKEVAQALNVTAATYSRYENGLIQPDLETLKRIAVLMKTSVDFLLGSPSENNSQVDDIAKKVMPALRRDEEKLLGVYNSLDQESKTQLMSVAYLITLKSLETQGINVQQLIEQQLHKIQEKGGKKDEG